MSHEEEIHAIKSYTSNAEVEIETALQKTKHFIEEEKSISVFQAIKNQPWEVFWSCVFSLGIVMAGFDGQIIASFYALDAFTMKFGSQLPDGSYEISAPWQTALGMGSPIGQVVGTLLVSWPLEWFGRKKTYFAANICVIGLLFMQFFAPSLGVLTAGEILSGLFWGCMVLIGPTYASEISQIQLRGILTAMNNLAFVIGQFIANGVADAYSDNTTQWAYKVPFALQWIWPALIMVLLPFAPESPYWLVRQKNYDAARDSLKKISSKSVSDESIDERLNVIIQTDALEQEFEQTTNFLDIFRGANLRRTEICTVVYTVQVLCGVPFAMNYSTYFFELAGLPTNTSFDLSLGSTAIGFTATILSWFAMAYIGRRLIYNWTLGFITVILWVIGFLDLAKNYDTNSSVAYAQAGLMLVWSFGYQMSAGPLCFVFIGEIPSTKLRSKTIAFATAIQAIFTIAATVALPYMLNETEGNMRGKVGFVFGAFSLVILVWCYFRLPETRNRSFEEIDIMFERGVPAREFRNYEIFKEYDDAEKNSSEEEVLVEQEKI